MTNHFKPGDQVVCINDEPSQGFTYPQGIPCAGKNYEVAGTSVEENKDDQIYIEGFTILKNGKPQGFSATRFKLCDPPNSAPKTKDNEDIRGLLRSLLADLEKPSPEGQRLASAMLIAHRAAAYALWRKNNGLSFKAQLAAMAALVLRCLNDAKYHPNITAQRVIDAFRKEEGMPTMLDSLATKTPPGSTPQSPAIHTMNHMSAYATIPVATPTLIYGDDIASMTDEQLISATKEIQLRIQKLRDIPGNSRKIARQIKEAEAAMAKIVEKLDADEKTAE